MAIFGIKFSGERHRAEIDLWIVLCAKAVAFQLAISFAAPLLLSFLATCCCRRRGKTRALPSAEAATRPGNGKQAIWGEAGVEVTEAVGRAEGSVTIEMANPMHNRLSSRARGAAGVRAGLDKKG